MARQPRSVHPGSIHHITARGIGRRTLFVDDVDRGAFVGLIAESVATAGWRCHSYCLMGNHYHLVVETAERGLAGGMYRLNSLFAQRYNRLYGVSGHVLDRRYANQPVRGQEHLLELARYVHLNPVRAGMCDRPENWRWSNYRAIAGTAPAPGFLDTTATLGLFGSAGGEERRRFVRFVEDGITRPTSNPADAARPALADLIRSLGLEGGMIAHRRHSYRQDEVAAALGINPRTFRRHLRAVSASGPGPEADIVTQMGTG